MTSSRVDHRTEQNRISNSDWALRGKAMDQECFAVERSFQVQPSSTCVAVAVASL